MGGVRRKRMIRTELFPQPESPMLTTFCQVPRILAQTPLPNDQPAPGGKGDGVAWLTAM